MARLETDHEALLEAQGFIARPGPRPKLDEPVLEVVIESIKACRILEIRYQSGNDKMPRWRSMAPYGVLTGARRYLVGRSEADPSGPVRTYRMDQIKEARVTESYFAKPAEFDLQAYARRAFGVFQSGSEYGEVVWRFVPEAAEHARNYIFHPEQTMEDQDDGSLLVRFYASGYLEMCWYLYSWGDKVEVLAPREVEKPGSSPPKIGLPDASLNRR